MQKKNVIICTIIIVIVAIGSFYAGMKYDKSKLSKQVLLRSGNNMSQGGNGNRQQGQGAQGGQRMGGGGFVSGDILSKDDKSITVKAQDGSSKIIFFSESTAIGKTTSGAASDLNVGGQVMINGKANSDGSITAQNIQIRPAAPESN